MPFSESYRDFVLDQLSGVLPGVWAKKMFGGVGIYAQGVFFALIADDVLYLYTAEEERPAREAEGARRFHHQYYEVPVEVLEDADELGEWARRALAAKRGGD